MNEQKVYESPEAETKGLSLSAAGADALWYSSWCYWTATEYDSDNAWDGGFGEGGTVYFYHNKKTIDGSICTRPCIAF